MPLASIRGMELGRLLDVRTESKGTWLDEVPTNHTRCLLKVKSCAQRPLRITRLAPKSTSGDFTMSRGNPMKAVSLQAASSNIAWCEEVYRYWRPF